ncbi:MAG: hypothetical protein ACT6U0_10010 [Shinella sp.]|uniref:hypothetical protein n=1 Tax=Shinella sp. TaxID=1870904 RepID=UPI004035BCE5
MVADLEAAGLVESLAAMRPLVTYKKAIDEEDRARRADKQGHRQMGRHKHDRY